ncbi:MAG TPA: response regulator transcription factor [Burkholderiaceae bacterium]|nr:response regulator transcription factor [Burkholderiaceae bacterium]
MRTLIIDDHPTFSNGLRLLLSALGLARDAETCTRSEQACQLLQARQFDLILMDWVLGSESLSGTALIARLKELAPDTRVVVVSGAADATAVRNAIDAGAVGFVPKETDSTTLIEAIRVTSQGRIYLPENALTSNPTPPSNPSGEPPPAPQGARLADAYPDLTPRQRDTLVCALRGEPNKVIARQLYLSEDTVKQHLKAVYRVLNVRNRAEAIYLLARQGIQVFE